MDSEGLAAPVDLETINENWATLVSEIHQQNQFQNRFISANSRVDSEIVNENWVATDS
jgi:hypothetical protein